MLLDSTCSDTRVIDHEELLRRCLGRLDLVERVLKVFEERFVCDLAELEACVARGELAEVATVAHRIKGSARSAAAGRLGDWAAAVEQCALQQASDEIPAYIDRMKDHWDRSQATPR